MNHALEIEFKNRVFKNDDNAKLEIIRKRDALKKQKKEYDLLIERLHEEEAELNKKEQSLDIMLDAEMNNKRFMLELVNTFPSTQGQIEKAREETNQNKATFKNNLSVPERKRTDKELRRVSTTVLKAKDLFNMNDDPEFIMQAMSFEKFHKIIKTLREKNLFLINIINEEEEQIEK